MTNLGKIAFKERLFQTKKSWENQSSDRSKLFVDGSDAFACSVRLLTSPADGVKQSRKQTPSAAWSVEDSDVYVQM